MRKFSILHLSDLHITCVRNTYSTILKKLISDIVEETKTIESLIVVVTGDIVDKAKYAESKDTAIQFFCDLKNRLKNKIKKMYFTPGNHDKNRIEHTDLMHSYFDGKSYDFFYDKFENGDWKNLFSHTFDNYKSMLREISEKTGIEIIDDLYYCDVFEINNCYVRINSLNSAVTSFSDKDNGLLHIGKFQIDKIERDFEKKKEIISGKAVDASITIMHHPTFWLCKEEYDKIQYSISSHDSLATDVLLRGHTHDRSLENYYSLYTSFSTLVTGVGSSEKKDEDHPQRYSIYTFMCDLNLIEIVMKSSSEKGFIPDYSAYVNKTDETRNKIHFPMHVHDFFSNVYLKLPLVKNDFQPIFPTKKVFENMMNYSCRLLNLKEKLTNTLFTYKQEFIATLSRSNESDEMIALVAQHLISFDEIDPKDKQDIIGVFHKYQSDITKSVNGLLYELCVEIINIFFKDTLKKEEQVRVQFRVLNKSRAHEGFVSFSLKGDDPIQDNNITPVPWGKGLIKESFEKKALLIYSLNKEHIVDRLHETIWTDYITYVPDIPNNTYYHSKTKTEYPVITFGINSNSLDCYAVFESLSLLPINDVIDDFLLDIHDSFNFSFESLRKK